MNTFGAKEIEKWSEAYDKYKYPFRIYYELVVEGRNNNRMLELMGAWKTGSLRINDNESEYKDDEGALYGFTKRWTKEAPVGYEVWHYVSNNITEFRKRIPTNFQEKEKPNVVAELESKKGFGYIWAVFVLHCIYPEIYPLYDQHVYRAFRYIDSANETLVQSAPASWKEYTDYRRFFMRLAGSNSYPSWKIDHALWAYGKYLKQIKKMSDKNDYEHSVRKYDAKESMSDEWVHSVTLGGKAKSFWWKMNPDSSISISRKFNAKNRRLSVTDIISEEELRKIFEYVGSNWVCLANNVERLGNETEKEGLGKFVFSELSWTQTKAQLSSHIGAIFQASAIWEHNGKKIGIEFRRKNSNWMERLQGYCMECINCHA
jgi:hypothetical protein